MIIWDISQSFFIKLYVMGVHWLGDSIGCPQRIILLRTDIYQIRMKSLDPLGAKIHSLE